MWIDEDYPKNIQEERKLLIRKLKEARNNVHKVQQTYNVQRRIQSRRRNKEKEAENEKEA